MRMYFRNGKERMFEWSLLSLSGMIATNNMNMLLYLDACMRKTVFLSEEKKKKEAARSQSKDQRTPQTAKMHMGVQA